MAVSSTSLPGRASQVQEVILRRSTTPSPASTAVHRPAPAGDPFAKPALARVDPDGQARASVPTEKGQEKTKEPEIEREPTEDVDLGDADCIARELLCRTPDQQEDKDLEGRARVGSSSSGEDDEEEGDELVALSMEYLQQCVFGDPSPY